MLKVASREYKVILDHRLFEDREDAVKAFWEEVAEFARGAGIAPGDEFGETKKRTIAFLDTPGFTLNLNRFILRRRAKEGGDKVEYTLKCRSEDRYVAAAAEVRASGDPDEKPKFEEDIGVPFRSRFAHSQTVDAVDGTPRSLGEAAAIFPALGRLQRDGMPCPPETPLRPVNDVEAFERVLECPDLRIGEIRAETALILWSNRPQGRPLVAEFSFRYKSSKKDEEQFPSETARAAMEFYLLLQRTDWVRPGGMTKTEYVYRTAAQD